MYHVVPHQIKTTILKLTIRRHLHCLHLLLAVQKITIIVLFRRESLEVLRSQLQYASSGRCFSEPYCTCNTWTKSRHVIHRVYALECVYCHAIKNKIKNHAVDTVKKL